MVPGHFAVENAVEKSCCRGPLQQLYTTHSLSHGPISIQQLYSSYTGYKSSRIWGPISRSRQPRARPPSLILRLLPKRSRVSLSQVAALEADITSVCFRLFFKAILRKGTGPPGQPKTTPRRELVSAHILPIRSRCFEIGLQGQVPTESVLNRLSVDRGQTNRRRSGLTPRRPRRHIKRTDSDVRTARRRAWRNRSRTRIRPQSLT